MTLSEIKNKINETTNQVVSHVKSLSEEDSNKSIDSKWSPNQHLDHLVKSMEPLNNGLGTMKMVIKTMFGKPNRGVRSYKEVFEKYTTKLKEAPSGPNAFSTKDKTVFDKKELLKTFEEEMIKMNALVDKWEENDLDEHLFPHPLLGKMIVREILYFVDFHTLHHLNSMQK